MEIFVHTYCGNEKSRYLCRELLKRSKGTRHRLYPKRHRYFTVLFPSAFAPSGAGKETVIFCSLAPKSLCRELVTSEEVATHIGISAVRGKHNNRNVGRDYQALCWRDLPLIDRAFNSNRYEGAQRGRRRGERQVAQKPERDQIALGAFASLQTTTWVKASRG